MSNDNQLPAMSRSLAESYNLNPESKPRSR